MVRGFYTLGSGILTQSRKLSGISNNIANVETPGYKKQDVSSTTFGDILISRIDSHSVTPIGKLGAISTVDKTNVIHSEGSLNNTGRNQDFAIKGEGFFAVQGQNNTGLYYTRNGSFNVDAQGYLTLNGVGRVVGNNGPIRVGTDSFTSDGQGNIYVNGSIVDKIAVYNFADYNNLKLAPNGLFTAAAGATQEQNPQILWKTLEGSNVDTAEEMTDAISAQRTLQSCSESLKMYDQVLQKAVTDIAKI